VLPMPLRSATVIDAAPISHSSSTSVRKTSLCVEPGAGSALLKLGLRSTLFPCAGLTPSSARARRTPSARFWVLTKATRAPPAGSVAVGLGDAVGDDRALAVGLGGEVGEACGVRVGSGGGVGDGCGVEVRVHVAVGFGGAGVKVGFGGNVDVAVAVPPPAGVQASNTEAAVASPPRVAAARRKCLRLKGRFPVN
jgi:hypothetical protein